MAPARAAAADEHEEDDEAEEEDGGAGGGGAPVAGLGKLHDLNLSGARPAHTHTPAFMARS
jgi:hypothetical protein